MPILWRWPPENSWGKRFKYCLSRPTSFKMEITISLRSAALPIPVDLERRADQIIHRHSRIERAVGILEDDLHPLAHLPHLLLVICGNIFAVIGLPDRRSWESALRWFCPEWISAAGFANQSQSLPLWIVRLISSTALTTAGFKLNRPFFPLKYFQIFRFQ